MSSEQKVDLAQNLISDSVARSSLLEFKIFDMENKENYLIGMYVGQLVQILNQYNRGDTAEQDVIEFQNDAKIKLQRFRAIGSRNPEEGMLWVLKDHFDQFNQMKYGQFNHLLEKQHIEQIKYEEFIYQANGQQQKIMKHGYQDQMAKLMQTKKRSFQDISEDLEPENGACPNKRQKLENSAENSAEKKNEKSEAESIKKQLQDEIPVVMAPDPIQNLAIDIDDASNTLIQQLVKEDKDQLLQRKEKENNEQLCKICYFELLEGEEEKLPENNFNEERPLEEVIAQIEDNKIIESSKIFPLSCEHVFHGSCLRKYFESEIGSNRFPLRCPENDCKVNVPVAVLKQLLTSDLMKKYYDRTLSNHLTSQRDMSWCPTADCGYAFVFDDNDTELRCPTCENHYCLSCRAKFHTGMSCDEYRITNSHSKEDDQFLSFVKGKKFKQCPKCNFWVERSEGCDHMTCRCSYHFCYKCGGKYGRCDCQHRGAQFPPPPIFGLPNRRGRGRRY